MANAKAPKGAPEADAAATQDFVALCNVFAASGSVEAGAKIALTRDEHKVLSGLGAIEGAWTDDAAKDEASKAE